MAYIFGGWVLDAGESTYLCELCGRCFGTIHAARTHCINAGGHWFCETCDQLFETEIAREYHLQDSADHHLCGICPNRPWFHDEDDLNLHLELYHYLCVFCHEVQFTQERMHLHNQRFHFVCEFCSRAFDRLDDHDGHHRTHGQRSHACSRCHHRWARFSELLSHAEEGHCHGKDQILQLARAAPDTLDVVNHPNCEMPYHCPNCYRPYRQLCQVFAHAESSRQCKAMLVEGRSLQTLQEVLSSRL